MTTSQSTPETHPNPTGTELLDKMTIIDAALLDPTLSLDAHEPLEERRGEILGQFTTAAEYADVLAAATGTTFPNPLTEALSKDGKNDDTPTPRPDVLARTIAPEELETKVAITKQALADKYSTPERLLRSDDFTVVTHIDEAAGWCDMEVSTVLFGSANGLDLGDPNREDDPARSYDAVMADDERHTLTIEGKLVDARTGCTDRTYRALIQQAVDNGLPLPDSMSGKEGVHLQTLFTGNTTMGRRVPCGIVRQISAHMELRTMNRNGGYRNIRFRPGAVVNIKPIES